MPRPCLRQSGEWLEGGEASSFDSQACLHSSWLTSGFSSPSLLCRTCKTQEISGQLSDSCRSALETHQRASEGKGFERPGAHPKECHKEAVAEEASHSGNPDSKENLGFAVSVFNRLVISSSSPALLSSTSSF